SSSRASSFACVWTFVVLMIGVVPAAAQEPPTLPYVAVDLHAATLQFPNGPLVAASRNLTQGELPRFGLGADVGVTVYPLPGRRVSVGIGGHATTLRAHHQQPTPPAGQTSTLQSVTEKMTSYAPQVSINFGTGDGWSYLSAGVGAAKWSIVPVMAKPQLIDAERVPIVEYGGGGRWFARPHVAFSFDARLLITNPSFP